MPASGVWYFLKDAMFLLGFQDKGLFPVSYSHLSCDHGNACYISVYYFIRLLI